MTGSSCIGVEDFYVLWDDVVSTGKVTDVSMNLATAILWVQEEWATWILNIVAASSSETTVITDQLAQTRIPAVFTSGAQHALYTLYTTCKIRPICCNKLDAGAICILRSHMQGKQKITWAQLLC